MQNYDIPKIKSTRRCNSIDMREVLKAEILKQGQPKDYQMNQPAVVGAAPQPAATVGFEDIELYFDSVNRDTSSDILNGEIKWPIPPLNNTQDIKNCIQVYVPTFFFPKIYLDATHPEYFYYRRVFLEITNSPSAQAILAPNNNRFHFEFKVNNINGQAVELVPIKETFFFQRPLTSLTDFNIRLMVPSNTLPNSYKKIPIPNDRVELVSLLNGGVGYNPMRFQIVSGETTAEVLGLVGSTGTPGLAAFITGYDSNDATVNNSVNDPNGVYITNIINATTFEINIDSTAVTAQYNASMYIPKNRIAFAVRFTSVRNYPTNYITVEHH